MRLKWRKRGPDGDRWLVCQWLQRIGADPDKIPMDSAAEMDLEERWITVIHYGSMMRLPANGKTYHHTTSWDEPLDPSTEVLGALKRSYELPD